MAFNFDAALGLARSPLNAAAAALFNNSSLFKGSVTQELDLLGQVQFAYQADQAPTFLLVGPTQAQWDEAFKNEEHKNDPKPIENALQISFDSITTTITIASAPPILSTFAFTAFATVSSTNSVLTIDIHGGIVDASKLGIIDEGIITHLVFPKAIEMADDALKAINIPSIPTVEGINFNPVKIDIQNQLLLISTTKTDNSKPISIEDFSFPMDKPYFTLLGKDIIEGFANTAAAKELVDKPVSGSVKKGVESLANAEVDYSANLDSVSVAMDSNDLTKVTIDVRPTLSASGSINGWAAVAACPVGAALNAL